MWPLVLINQPLVSAVSSLLVCPLSLPPPFFFWLAHSVKRPTLGFGLGHDLTIHKFEPQVGLCAAGAKPAWDSLSLPLSAPPQCSLVLS